MGKAVHSPGGLKGIHLIASEELFQAAKEATSSTLSAAERQSISFKAIKASSKMREIEEQMKREDAALRH